MQNLPIKFPNKKGILVLTPTLLKFMSLFLNKFKLGFCSDTYLPFGPNSRFLLFFFFGGRPLQFSIFTTCSYQHAEKIQPLLISLIQTVSAIVHSAVHTIRFCTWPKLLLGCSCTLDLQKIPQLWFFVSATCCCIKEYLTKYHKILQKNHNCGFSYPKLRFEPQLWIYRG